MVLFIAYFAQKNTAGLKKIMKVGFFVKKINIGIILRQSPGDIFRN